MAKFYGKIGFSRGTHECPPHSGIWKDDIVERSYYGELIRNRRQTENSGQVNDNINISNEISIVADPFANCNFYAIRYIVYAGAKWKVTSVDAGGYPRLILTLGGLFNDA